LAYRILFCYFRSEWSADEPTALTRQKYLALRTAPGATERSALGCDRGADGERRGYVPAALRFASGSVPFVSGVQILTNDLPKVIGIGPAFGAQRYKYTPAAGFGQ